MKTFDLSLFHHKIMKWTWLPHHIFKTSVLFTLVALQKIEILGIQFFLCKFQKTYLKRIGFQKELFGYFKKCDDANTTWNEHIKSCCTIYVCIHVTIQNVLDFSSQCFTYDFPISFRKDLKRFQVLIWYDASPKPRENECAGMVQKQI